MKDNRTIEQMWREMTAPQPVEEALNMQVKRVADQLKKLMDKEKNVQKKMKMADEVMQNILGEEYGAGELGTDKLRKTYAKDTPGQMPNAELAVDGVPTVGGQITKPDPFKGAAAVQKPKGVSLAEDPVEEQKEEKTELDEMMTRDERIAAIKAAHQRVMQKDKEAEARAKRDAKRGMKAPGATKGMADVKMEAKKLDPVGKADADIDNDGDVDKSDSYLHNRRKAIKKAMKEALRIKDTSGSLGDLKKAKQGASLSAKSIAQDTRKAAASDIKDIRKKTAGNPVARKQAMAKADYAVKKEELQQVDEISAKTLSSYKDKATKDMPRLRDKMYQPMGKDNANWKKNFNDLQKRKKGIDTANKKLGVDESMMDAVKSKLSKLKKSVSDFHKTDVAAQIRKNKTTQGVKMNELSNELVNNVAKKRAIKVGSAMMKVDGDRRDPEVQKAMAKKKANDSLRFNRGARQISKAVGEEYTDKEIRMGKGVAFDKRYKDGNYSGAYKTINKIKKGLADHPKVKDALRRANEEFNKGE